MTAQDSDHQTYRIVLVQCTNAKRDEPAPARNLYDESNYFVKQREYAEAVADYWFIQSAKHGLLEPDQLVEPYDKHAKDLDDPDKWGEEIASTIEEKFGEAVVEILGGKRYADPLTPALERRGFDVIEPLRGQGIGTRMSSLKDMRNRKLGGFA